MEPEIPINDNESVHAEKYDAQELVNDNESVNGEKTDAQELDNDNGSVNEENDAQEKPHEEHGYDDPNISDEEICADMTHAGKVFMDIELTLNPYGWRKPSLFEDVRRKAMEPIEKYIQLRRLPAEKAAKLDEHLDQMEDDIYDEFEDILDFFRQDLVDFAEYVKTKPGKKLFNGLTKACLKFWKAFHQIEKGEI